MDISVIEGPRKLLEPCRCRVKGSETSLDACRQRIETRGERKDWQVEEVLTASRSSLCFRLIAYKHGGLLLVARMAATLVDIAQRPDYHHRTMEPKEGHVTSFWSYNNSRYHGCLHVHWETSIILKPSCEQGGRKAGRSITRFLKPSSSTPPCQTWPDPEHKSQDPNRK